MSRSCVCGGSNESCRFCGGLGTIPDTLATALVDRLQRLESEQRPVGSPKIRRKLVSHRLRPKPMTSRARAATVRRERIPARPAKHLVPCPHGCGASLNPLNLSRHLNKVHATVSAALQQTANLTPSHPTLTKAASKYGPCPACKATVRVDRIERHMAKVHKNLVLRPHIAHAHSIAPITYQQAVKPAQKPPTPKQAGHEYKFCPICKARVRDTRIRKHMTKVHMRRVVRPHVTVVRSSKDPLRQSTSLVAPRDKNLDATKLYAHPYRERGRYGSHPSHDGFDDESSPN
jgi:hypothetical protein